MIEFIGINEPNKQTTTVVAHDDVFRQLNDWKVEMPARLKAAKQLRKIADELEIICNLGPFK